MLKTRKFYIFAHMEKLRFTHFRTRIDQDRSLAASDLFHMFTKSIKFYTFHCHMLNSRDVSKKGDSLDS